MFMRRTDLLDQSIAGEPSDGSNERSPDRTNTLQENLAANGYVIVRNVLTPEQVQSLRLAMKTHLKAYGWYNYGGKFQVQAMHAIPAVAEILTSDAILHVLQEITQPLDVVLTGECDLMINTTSTWHKDITHHPVYMDGRIFADEGFRVYKVAFYLQDQGETSRATLKVRPMSHRLAQGGNMPVKKAAVRAGDALIFDVRIDHLGQMPTLADRVLRKVLEKLGPKLHIDAQKALTGTRSTMRWLRHQTADRMAVFMTFGPSEPWTLAYAEACQYRHAPVQGKLTADVLSRLACNHVAMLKK
jgi:hypothetical protein